MSDVFLSPYGKFNRICDRVRGMEVGIDREVLLGRMARDIGLFTAVILESYVTRPFSKFHHELFRELLGMVVRYGVASDGVNRDDRLRCKAVTEQLTVGEIYRYSNVVRGIGVPRFSEGMVSKSERGILKKFDVKEEEEVRVWQPSLEEARGKLLGDLREMVDRASNVKFLEGAQRMAIAAPRGTAKSTLAAEAFPLWCICHRVCEFILIVSDTEDQAKMRLDMIRNELETNERLRLLYGDLVGKDVWGSLEIETANGVKVVVKGTGQKIRGLKYRRKRPELVICHAPGTVIEDEDLGVMKVEDHPTATYRESQCVKVSLTDYVNDEIVSEDHMYWARESMNHEPRWIAAKDLRKGYLIGKQVGRHKLG